MKFPWTMSLLLLALTAIAVPHSTANKITHSDVYVVELDETLLQTRLQALNLPVSVRFTPSVQTFISEFTTYGKKGSEAMLGRAVLYFPTFEYYLNLYGLPSQLKYLAMVESNLRPNATSEVGAAGLWQLMPSTAQQLGLHVNSYVDERRDPHSSTEAAVRFLADLYKQFGSWELALAAYNCGAGNVSKAIRNGGSKDFWKIREYLPAQTQVYVPRFIAAAYLAEYYTQHGLQPVFPEYDLRFSRTIRVYSQLPLNKVASITGISISVIRKLNPAYRQGIIPASTKGHFLTLPELGIMAFQDYLRWSGNSDIKTDLVSVEQKESLQAKGGTTVLVAAGDSINSIANQHGCTKYEIMEWNQLRDENLYFHQELVLFVTSANTTVRRS
ncbi:MAG: transglycosylase SLT domain-containing protein [Saprospirales bacterium]|nr:transglycosylase SLT domain-containing protein [Saprospirales bacterium]